MHIENYRVKNDLIPSEGSVVELVCACATPTVAPKTNKIEKTRATAFIIINL